MQFDSLAADATLSIVDSLAALAADTSSSALGLSERSNSFDWWRFITLTVNVGIAAGVLWAAISASKAYRASVESLGLTRTFHTDDQHSKRPYLAPAERAGYFNLQVDRASSILKSDIHEGLNIRLKNFGTNPVERALGNIYLITKVDDPDKYFMSSGSMEVYAANPLSKGQEWSIRLPTEEVERYELGDFAGLPGFVETFIWMELKYRDAVQGLDFEEDLYWAVGRENQLVEPSVVQHKKLRALAEGEKKLWTEANEIDTGPNSDPPTP